ncbi:MAG TPA: hypothetical protein VFE32_04760 [Puia sp.]|jgi:hypothetical protein|nr:hypothetical protein [Puia sp.]
MEFIAKVEESRRAHIREIAESLGKMGVEVRQVQPILGLITGVSEVLSLEQVKIEGIASVELVRNWGVGMPEEKKIPVEKNANAKKKRS